MIGLHFLFTGRDNGPTLLKSSEFMSLAVK